MGELDAAALMNELREGFDSGKTMPAEFRIKQLKAIIRMVDENEEEILKANKTDMNRPHFETFTAEVIDVSPPRFSGSLLHLSPQSASISAIFRFYDSFFFIS
jgi:hypothetical protein